MTPVRIALMTACVVVGLIAVMVLLDWWYKRTWAKTYQRIVRYMHHGRSVAVRADLQGKHRQHCLCYGCERFYDSANGGCPIAKATFDNCVKFGTVTPIWECPKYEEQPNARKPPRRPSRR